MPAFELSEARETAVFVPDPGPGASTFVAPAAPPPEPEPEPASEEALAQAYAAGVTAGEAAAREALPIHDVEALRSATETLETLAGSLAERAEAKLVAEPREIVELALSIAEHLLCTRLDGDPEALTARIQRAVRGLPDAEPLRIEVSPRDRGTLEVMREDLGPLASGTVEIVDHPSLEPGEFRIAAGASEVDARGPALLASVREALSEEIADAEDSG